MRASFARLFKVSFVAVAVGLTCSMATASATQGPGQKRNQEIKPPAAAENDLDVTMAAARTMIGEGRLEDALGLIKEKAAKHPDWSPPHLMLAQLLFAANQNAQARRALEQAAAVAPDHPDVYLILGGLAMAESRLSDARLNFQNVLTLAGTGRWDAEKTHSLRCEALKALAAISEAREDWTGARGFLTTWLELEPKNGQARQRLGRVEFRLGKEEQAFESLKQAVKDAPVLDPAAVSMGFLYGAKGDAKKAEEWFDYGRKLEPRNPRVRIGHAGWLLDRGEAANARKEIDEALLLDPASKDAQRVSALIAWCLRDLEGAEKILELLHRDAPADSFVANLLALALVEQDNAAKRSRGLKLAEANTVQFPHAHEATTTLGWALYRAGRIDEADQKLQTGIASGGLTPDVAYFWAHVLADRGKIDDARGLLQRATKQPGAFAHRDDALALLKTMTK